MAAILRVKDDAGKIYDIPAIRGKDGHSPIRGVDYFTEEDKIEMCNKVFAMLPSLEMVATLDDGSTKTYHIYGGAVTE